MFSKSKRVHTDKLVDAVLADADLLAHKKTMAGLLSGGQLRLLELARLRLAKGKMLLIDEPTAGVAPLLRNKLSEIIVKLVKDHGHTAIIVEHDIKFLFNIADRILVFVDGEKYLEGTPETVRADERLKKVYLGE
jgi:branched-chain amino acid transport system ATP-binding protein